MDARGSRSMRAMAGRGTTAEGSADGAPLRGRRGLGGVLRRRALVALGLLLAVGAPARAQEAVEPFSPGGYDITVGTDIVPRRTLHVEAGVAFARTRAADSPDERRLAAQLALRTGLAPGLEVGLSGEPVVRLRGPEEDTTDHGDLTVTLKYRFLDAREDRWEPALGVQPFVTVPLADAPIGSERPDFGVLALAGFALPWQLALDLNAGVAAVGQARPSGYLAQALAAALLARPIAGPLSAFGELVFATRGERDGRDALGANAGLVLELTHTMALGVAVETSVVGPGPDYALRAALSVRLPR